MSKRQRIRNPKENFTILPNMYDDASLTAYEFRLLVHYRRVGNCYESLRTTAKKCNVGKSTVERARRSLAEKGWITLGESNKGTVQVEVVDRWSAIPPHVGGTNEGVPQGDSSERDVPQGDTVSLVGTECPTESTEEVLIKKNSLSSKKDSRSNDRGKKKKKRDPLLDHPAIIEYKDEARLNVYINWRKEVAETVGDDPEEVKRWRAVVHDWIGRGWNKQNVKGMLEVFRNPVHKVADAYQEKGA